MRHFLSKLKRIAKGEDYAIKSKYLAESSLSKLQIGASNRVLDGWLNTDIHTSPGVMYMDATRRFPFADSTFDYILAEHMIEHVSYKSGQSMLAECRRVLRPGGVVRIVTPDLEKLAGLYAAEPENTYVDWFCQTFVAADRPQTVGSVLNAHFSMWGHQFLYDETLLADAMRKAGFTSIARMEVGESAHAALAGIENEGRYPPGLLKFESLALEAQA